MNSDERWVIDVDGTIVDRQWVECEELERWYEMNEGIGAARGPGAQAEQQQMPEGAQAQAQPSGIMIGGTGGPPELQAILVQLGRIADQLQEIAKELKQGQGTQKPQPFGG